MNPIPLLPVQKPWPQEHLETSCRNTSTLGTQLEEATLGQQRTVRG